MQIMEDLTVDKLTVGLYKFLNQIQEDDIKPNVQMYLCGMIDKVFHPENCRINPTAWTVKEKDFDESLNLIKREIEATPRDQIGIPLAKAYYICKFTGEFNVVTPVFNSKMPDNIYFPQRCFGEGMPYAKLASNDEEHTIFGLFAMDLERYVKILLGYVNMINSGKLELTKKDYKKFKEYVIQDNTKDQKGIISGTPTIQEEKIDDLLI